MSVRALAAAALFAVLLSAACPEDSMICQEKFTDNATVRNGILSLPVSTDTTLVYSVTPPPQSIKQDPFLGLYLVRASVANPHVYVVTGKRSQDLTAIEVHTAIKGKIVKEQAGINMLAQFDRSLVAPGVLNGPCCNLEGIVTSRGVIDKEYIRHFLQGGQSPYGDAGIRVEDVSEGVAVVSVDPFVSGNPFEAGDIIRRCDGQPVSSAAALMQKILFSSPGKSFDFTIKRDGKERAFAVVLIKRYGGGLISDTYLERNGFYFDAGLTLTMASGDAAYTGLLRGDRLVRINGTDVLSWEDVRSRIGGNDKEALLLFERDGFQFFIHLPYKQAT